MYTASAGRKSNTIKHFDTQVISQVAGLAERVLHISESRLLRILVYTTYSGHCSS